MQRPLPTIDLNAAATKLAEAIVDDLFINGAGQHGTRLVMMDESNKQRPLNLGGWCKEAVRSRIIDIVLTGKVPTSAGGGSKETRT
jgi:hypothetical protein